MRDLFVRGLRGLRVEDYEGSSGTEVPSFPSPLLNYAAHILLDPSLFRWRQAGLTDPPGPGARGLLLRLPVVSGGF